MTRDLQMNLDSLQAALEQESYPHRYCHKFIGYNTQAFRDALKELEDQFPRARRLSQRGSGGGGANARYLALTYELDADNAGEIVELVRFTSGLVDLKIIL